MTSRKHYLTRTRDSRTQELRRKISDTLLSTQVNMDEVEKKVSSFEKRLEEILYRLDDLENRLKKLEEILG
ncbi:MAG: hypothetical protein DRO13_05355 [Thermoprotei archaeon]|nr:MAG: hypothetical protein DRO13_05355 [Thermoprotei archaeon]